MTEEKEKDEPRYYFNDALPMEYIRRAATRVKFWHPDVDFSGSTDEEIVLMGHAKGKW